MPTVPSKTKCETLGCNNPKSKYNRFCLEHGGRDTQYFKHKPKSAKYIAGQEKYQSALWQTTRQVQLSRQPLCQSCLIRGIVKQAEHVDHVFPWQQIGEHAFIDNLFQSLCQSCHSSKTMLEQKGTYRHYNKKIIDYTLNDYKRVADMDSPENF